MMDAFILYDGQVAYGVYFTIAEVARTVSESLWLRDWTVKPLIFAGDAAMVADAEKQVKDYIQEWY